MSDHPSYLRHDATGWWWQLSPQGAWHGPLESAAEAAKAYEAARKAQLWRKTMQPRARGNRRKGTR